MVGTKTLFFTLLGIAVPFRLMLTNINAAEWGDSYRILRASNHIRQLSYPDDEKRPPLFSALLAVRPSDADAVVWGRFFMLGVSFASLFVFYLLSKKYLTTQKQRLLALIFLFFNPVYLYWSLRIYADTPFSLLVMLCFYTFEIWRKKADNEQSSPAILAIVMGTICGLGILTRFEGYLLAASVVTGIAFDIKKRSTRKLRALLGFILTTGIVILPWLIYKNPLNSPYFEEPAGRRYDLTVFLTYLVSYLFVLGIIPAFSLVTNLSGKNWKREFGNVVTKYPHIVTFVMLESALILAWPAAVPRLFIPIIPFLVVLLVKSLDGLESQPRKLTVFTSTILIVIYTLTQNKLRLQFLGPHNLVFVTVIALSLIGFVALMVKNRILFIASAFLSMLTLGSSTIYLHKNIYKSIVEIATFPLQKSSAKILHNDTASIVQWYYPDSEYKNLDDKKYLTKDYLVENQVDYLIITNEFNPNSEIDLKKRPYLQLVKESRYIRGGKMFFTWLVEVKDETINSDTLL